MSLTEEQSAAVHAVLNASAPIVALTGGPGVGKTYTVTEIVRRLEGQAYTYRLTAPSGKAAQNLREHTGRQAQTLHSLLGLRPGQYRPDPERRPYVDADVLVIDEASFVDAQLLGAVVDARRNGRIGTVLLVGDADQLPPVGAGAPFLDLLDSGAIPAFRLTQIHRQAEGSGIVQAAHAIREGRTPTYNETDFRLVRVPEAPDVPAAIAGLCESEGLDHATSQILVPQSTGPAGFVATNQLIESQRGADEELVRDSYRAGTKVVNTRNDRERGVLNGDLGFVLEAESGADYKDDRVTVAFDSGAEATFAGAALKGLLPAWAMTCHRSQGSQWDDVVVVAHKTHTHMLTRALLYVAVTRAARRVFVVGTPGAVARAVTKVDDLTRRTMLSRWAHAAKAEREAVAS